MGDKKKGIVTLTDGGTTYVRVDGGACDVPCNLVGPCDVGDRVAVKVCGSETTTEERGEQMSAKYSNDAFAAKLVELRKYQARITQEELANRSGIDKNSIARYETGDTTPGLDKVVALALALDVTLDELYPIEGEVA